MKLSIITPSYQQGPFIERTIQSVLNQQYPDLEYLIFDGGSTDETVEVLKKYQSSLQWVSEKDNGQAHAVNKGILASTGDIIGWLNSDDVYYPGAFQKVMDFFEEHPEIDIVYGLADHIGLDDKAFEEYPTESWNFERLKDICFICQPSVFFRKKVFQQYGLLREDLNYCMDYEYWLRLGQNGVNFALINEKIAGSRFYQDTKTMGARKKVHYEINDMMKEKFGMVPTRWLFNYAHVLLENKINQQQHPHWFKLNLTILSLWASYHWNKAVHQDVKLTIQKWWGRQRMA